MCKVPGCKEKHTKHYCRICSSGDSDHFSSVCPEGADMYHGTRVNFVSPICEQGLKPSETGCLGPGVYFTKRQFAETIAKDRGAGTGVAVFRARVNVKDCSHRMHEPWAGIKTDFPEWCLTSKRMVLQSVFLMDGEINEDIYAPKIKIILGGEFKLKGKLRARQI